MSAPKPNQSVENDLGLPLAAIVCLAVGGYVILIVIIIIIRNCLISRGICTCGSPCECAKGEGQCCSCICLREACSCQSMGVNSCVNAICPKRKSLGCMDMILCNCCGDGEAVPNACGCCNLDLNVRYINCCCFTIRLAQNERYPSSEMWASQLHMNSSERYPINDFSKNAVSQNVTAEPNSLEISERTDANRFEGAASPQSRVPSAVFSNVSLPQRNIPRIDSNTATCLTLQEMPSHTSIASKKSHRLEGKGDEAKKLSSVRVDKTELDLSLRYSKRERSIHTPVRGMSAKITNPYSPRSKSSIHQHSTQSKSSTITNPYSARSAVSSGSSHLDISRVSQTASPVSISRSLPTQPSFMK